MVGVSNSAKCKLAYLSFHNQHKYCLVVNSTTVDYSAFWRDCICGRQSLHAYTKHNNKSCPLQACTQPRKKVTQPASGLQEKKMGGRGTKPAGKHNHWGCSPTAPLSTSCSPMAALFCFVFAQTHSMPHVAQMHNPTTTLHAPPPHPYTTTQCPPLLLHTAHLKLSHSGSVSGF
jgi:hypothetical protein